MEKVLISYEWGESFLALDVVAKPAIDETLLLQLITTARRHGDSLLGLITDSAYRYVRRSRIWTAALVHFASEHADNIALMRGWVDKWSALAA